MSPPGAPSAVVCDDEPALQEAVTGLLSQAGFRVERTTDLVGLPALAASLAASVVVLDLDMAGSSGLATVRLLAAAPAAPVVVALSAFPALRADAVGAGAAGLVDVHDLRGLVPLVAGALTPRPRTRQESLPAGSPTGSVSTNPCS